MRTPGQLLVEEVWAEVINPRDQLSVKFGQSCEIWSMFSVHLHVGHHIVHHVGHHVSHHNVISTLKVSKTLTEWKSESETNGQTDVPG